MLKNLSNKELVAAGHKFAANLDADTPLIDRAKMVSELATRLDVALAAAAEAGKQRDALAAENSSMMALAIACEKEFGSYTAEEFPDEVKVSYPEERCHITFGMIRKALNKAATDSILKSVRAEGVEMFAAAIQGGCAVGDRVKDLAETFAAQLRSQEAK